MIRICSVVVISLVALAATNCGSVEPSPTGPTPAANQVPAPAPGAGKLEISITPSPVPWTNQSMAECTLANAWTYEQRLRNVGGARMTITDRTDFFDGAETGTRSGLGIVLDPGQDYTIVTRWCSANATEHRTQTNFTGTDAANARIDVTGPTVRLLAR